MSFPVMKVLDGTRPVASTAGNTTARHAKPNLSVSSLGAGEVANMEGRPEILEEAIIQHPCYSQAEKDDDNQFIN